MALRSDDRLYVFSRDDVDFLNRTPVRRIVLGQPNTLTECASLDRLEALVRDSQTLRFNVVTRSAFIVERGGLSDLASTGGTIATGSRGGDAVLRSGDDQVRVEAPRRRRCGVAADGRGCDAGVGAVEPVPMSKHRAAARRCSRKSRNCCRC